MLSAGLASMVSILKNLEIAFPMGDPSLHLRDSCNALMQHFTYGYNDQSDKLTTNGHDVYSMGFNGV
jgi:hypothetical protein